MSRKETADGALEGAFRGSSLVPGGLPLAADWGSTAKGGRRNQTNRMPVQVQKRAAATTLIQQLDVASLAKAIPARFYLCVY